jgi:tetratricopeptide (TPR) repeat protein
VVGALTDERVSPPLEALAAAIVYFPGSARLNARLAEQELVEEERDLSLAESYAGRAVNLSPWDYNYRLCLANVDEAAGNREAAEGSLRNALALAPNNADVHWRMANLLLRLGKAEEAFDEFHKATVGNTSLLEATLDLIWRVSGGKVDQLDAVTSKDPKSRLVLARFLLKQSRTSEAAIIFSNIDRLQRRKTPETSAFLSVLIDSGRWGSARELWLDTVSADGTSADQRSSLIWNGSFETESARDFPQFDWNIGASQYARIGISGDIAHSGSHSLRISFTGRDTTRIDGEIKQLVVIKPGQHYRVECYARSDRLITPGAPYLAVLEARTLREIGASGPAPTGSSDWAPLSCEFIVPENCEAVLIEIRRLPKFSYDEPTQGTMWIDDFRLMELRNGK